MFNDSSEIASRAQDEFLLTIEKLNAIVGEDIGASGEADSFSDAGLLSESSRELNDALSKLLEATSSLKTIGTEKEGARTGSSKDVLSKISAERAIKKGTAADAAPLIAAAGRQCACPAAAGGASGIGKDLGAKEKEEIKREGEEKLGEIEKSAAEKAAKELSAHEAESRMYHKSTWNLRVKSVAAGVSTAVDVLEALYVAFGSNSKILFEAMKAASIVETVVQTAIAVKGAYDAYREVPPPVGPMLAVAAAVAALAFGAARIASIARTKPGDHGATVEASETNALPDGANIASMLGQGKTNAQGKKDEPKGVVTVVIDKLNEAAWAKVVEDDLIPALNEAAVDRKIKLSVKAFA